MFYVVFKHLQGLGPNQTMSGMQNSPSYAHFIGAWCIFQADNDNADTGASNADTDEWADDSSNDGNDGSVHGSMISGAVDY